MSIIGLRVGSRGSNVIRLQQLLMQAGFSPMDNKIDGIFGRNTETAVKAFQATLAMSPANGWGVIDASTASALETAASRSGISAPVLPYPMNSSSWTNAGVPVTTSGGYNLKEEAPEVRWSLPTFTQPAPTANSIIESPPNAIPPIYTESPSIFSSIKPWQYGVLAGLAIGVGIYFSSRRKK